MSQLFVIGKSRIHGNGVIAVQKIYAGQSIGEGIVFVWHLLVPLPIVTEHLGKWINHSSTPNTGLRWRNGAWHLVANRDVMRGEEMTLNYADTPWYIEGPQPDYV